MKRPEAPQAAPDVPRPGLPKTKHLGLVCSFDVWQRVQEAAVRQNNTVRVFVLKALREYGVEIPDEELEERR